MLNRNLIEKTANDYAVGAYGVPKITCDETSFNNGLYAEVGMEDKLTFEDYLKALDNETK